MPVRVTRVRTEKPCNSKGFGHFGGLTRTRDTNRINFIYTRTRSLAHIYRVYSPLVSVSGNQPPNPPAVNGNNESSTRLVIQENTDSSRFRWVSAPIGGGGCKRSWFAA